MATVECSGGTLFYEERGAGPPLLLVPGTGGHTQTLSAVADELASSYRTIVYDRRGHGGSTAPRVPRKQYVAQQIEDAACLLRALDVRDAIVFGWSWGGIVALGLAIEHPELVQRLVLHEPPFHIKKHMTPSIASGIGGAILLGKLGMPRRGALRFARFALTRTDGTNSFEELSHDMRESLLANAQTIVAELDAGTGEELTAERLCQLRCPVSVIVGGRTRQFLQDAAQRVQQLVPATNIVRIEEGDHLVNILRPDLLVGAIRQCLHAAAAS